MISIQCIVVLKLYSNNSLRSIYFCKVVEHIKYKLFFLFLLHVVFDLLISVFIICTCSWYIIGCPNTSYFFLLLLLLFFSSSLSLSHFELLLMLYIWGYLSIYIIKCVYFLDSFSNGCCSNNWPNTMKFMFCRFYFGFFCIRWFCGILCVNVFFYLDKFLFIR